MQRMEGVPAALVYTIQGMTVLLVSVTMAVADWPAVRRWLRGVDIAGVSPNSARPVSGLPSSVPGRPNMARRARTRLLSLEPASEALQHA
ncbi:MAG: hypothetical protein NUW23_00135 [Firmicutes bacterium]|nr:hypothetical protein [Bacillota bacterium]